jgi:hypothetical protein
LFDDIRGIDRKDAGEEELLLVTSCLIGANLELQYPRSPAKVQWPFITKGLRH